MDISLILFLFTERYNVICVIICIIHNNVNRTNILFSEISLPPRPLPPPLFQKKIKRLDCNVIQCKRIYHRGLLQNFIAI